MQLLDGQWKLAPDPMNRGCAERWFERCHLQETSHRSKFVADYQPGRLYNAGGIVLPVLLQVVPAVRIADLFARTDPDSGQIQLVVTVRNDTAAPAHGRLAIWAGPANSADALAAATSDTIEFTTGQLVPHGPNLCRRDLIYAKAAGFNMVRFSSGMAWPEQLDFCDEIGLMVYKGVHS